MLGLGWTYTEGHLFMERNSVRFRMDLHTEGALIHGGKFMLGLGWTYTLGGLIHGGKFVLGLGWIYT